MSSIEWSVRGQKDEDLFIEILIAGCQEAVWRRPLDTAPPVVRPLQAVRWLSQLYQLFGYSGLHRKTQLIAALIGEKLQRTRCFGFQDEEDVIRRLSASSVTTGFSRDMQDADRRQLGQQQV